MKWDVKLFIIFILTVFLYGGSYVFTHGSFAFPLEYVDVGIALVSLVFLLKTPFSQYSIIKILFGASFTYLLFGVKQMTDGNPTIFMLLRDFTILLFAIFLFIRVFRGKDKQFRGLFLFFGLIVLLQMVFNGINFTQEKYYIADLIKSLIVFILSVIVVRQTEEGDDVKLGIKRMFILIGLYTFRNILSLLVENVF